MKLVLAKPRKDVAVLLGAAAVVIVTVIALLLFVPRLGQSQSAEPAVGNFPVELSAQNVPEGTVLGIVLTLGSYAGSGPEWNQAAQGAAVAMRRFTMGGTNMVLATANDRGTDDGAKAAIDELSNKGVAGIVIASAGSQATAAVSAARQAGIPTISPYTAVGETATQGTWSTAPRPAAVSTALNAALEGANRALLVNAGGQNLQGLGTTASVDFVPGADVNALAGNIAALTGASAAAQNPSTDGSTSPAEPAQDLAEAVLINGDAVTQAGIVKALQAAKVTVPLLLSPSAISPTFSEVLTGDGGAVSGSLITVGANWGDATALRKDSAGRAMSAFLAGVRVLADDPSAKNLTGDDLFANTARAADSRSHDAVVALVRAVSAAKSNEPSKVSASLSGLKLGPADGVAGPVLDFTRAAALSGEITPLYASVQDLKLRPDKNASGKSNTIVWFPGPQQN